MKNLEHKYRVVLAKALMSIFNTGDWDELFTITECTDFPENHTRFFQDVNWQNASLKMSCINAVDHILDADPKNITHIWEMDKVQDCLSRKYSDIFNIIEDIINNNDAKLVAKPEPININDVVNTDLECFMCIDLLNKEYKSKRYHYIKTGTMFLPRTDWIVNTSYELTRGLEKFCFENTKWN